MGLITKHPSVKVTKHLRRPSGIRGAFEYIICLPFYIVGAWARVPLVNAIIMLILVLCGSRPLTLTQLVLRESERGSKRGGERERERS